MVENLVLDAAQERLVRERERARITGVCRTRWYELERRDLAPKRRRIGPASTAWRLSELLVWVQGREVGAPPAPKAALRARGVAA
jgi:predicted DNA-binding transcriptional regulator AlpA